MSQTLEQWLNRQEALRPNSAIQLGLERCHTVAGRLGLLPPPFPLISVAGTNGKGSTVAAIEAILHSAGQRTGTWTSPHLLRFGERIRVAGKNADDAALQRLFEQVDTARGTVELTYFECGALMAMLYFCHQQVSIAVLEVGLGGRLDAVNVFSPAVAVITRIALDHCQWLGADREQIGAEKAAIMRPQRAAVCGDPAPPRSLLATATSRGALLTRVGVDYHYHREADGWCWSDPQRCLSLPEPGLTDTYRHLHCATAIAAVFALPEAWRPDAMSIAPAIAAANIRGRCQQLHLAPTAPVSENTPAPEVIVDIAHNPEATAALAAFLRATEKHQSPRYTLAIVAVLQDKDASAMLAALRQQVAHWYCVTLDAPRGRAAEALCRHCPGPSSAFDTFSSAYQAAYQRCDSNDRIIIFGSVLVVAEALRLEQRQALQHDRQQ